ncbi:MetQ/NlpA family ABC transporter substrate-binding protein [Trueperella pyogenes]|uniref:MetQ/NlpA family ABC transporter substrate-binding protein n=1 Tax=Trueperella pyogenes TaxID=1661 RepID=UPI00056E726E|nr:MetQ/NlpA family ABC transporter substrate-binding protein [Trueperella pyogenes]AWA43066.1 ABC transporter substrate-binding protein [Trueperella pyogenes]AZR00576.1 ABC transporter substrate-binding protein [Trueperella pyogenes]OQD38860.1 ABC transporter [Trueperella pyogenes]UVJ57007.1 MetQ/NlpA family ABC transporter substrate-binding protein [Trueperella pyogenes]
MRKIFAVLAAAALTLTACSSKNTTTDTTSGASSADATVKLVVGASPVPHAPILQFVADNLAAGAGIDLEVKEYTDYVQPNVGLDAGELDANFFQHLPYLEAQIKDRGYDLEHGVGIHIEPFGIYSKKVTSLADVADGGVVLVTNDPSNQARGLKLLAAEGLITLADVANPTIYDVKDNPKNLQIRESEAPAIPVQLPDVDLAIINGNFALEAGLVPAKDALALESGENNPYANILAWKKGTKKIAAVKKLDELLHSPEVAQFIKDTYPNGEVTAAF